jgi:hypothetical protein
MRHCEEGPEGRTAVRPSGPDEATLQPDHGALRSLARQGTLASMLRPARLQAGSVCNTNTLLAVAHT